MVHNVSLVEFWGPYDGFFCLFFLSRWVLGRASRQGFQEKEFLWRECSPSNGGVLVDNVAGLGWWLQRSQNTTILRSAITSSVLEYMALRFIVVPLSPSNFRKKEKE